MKLTQARLKQIIREELHRVLTEGGYDTSYGHEKADAADDTPFNRDEEEEEDDDDADANTGLESP